MRCSFFGLSMILPCKGRWQPERLTEGCHGRRGHPAVGAPRRRVPPRWEDRHGSWPTNFVIPAEAGTQRDNQGARSAQPPLRPDLEGGAQRSEECSLLCLGCDIILAVRVDASMEGSLMSTDAASVLAADIQPKSRPRARPSFFFGMALLLLGLVIVGFAPTFYLRALFPVPPIPPHLYLHGAILTCWFLWLVLQTWLVRTGRTAQHRRLGVAGAVIAAAVVLAGPMASFGLITRVRATGVPWEADMSGLLGPQMQGVKMIDFFSGVIWGNFFSIAIFAALISSAIILRKRPQAHKRLMLLASIAIIAPALGRISRIAYLGGEAGPMPAIVFLGLLLLVFGYDIRTRRRPHRATLSGGGLIVVGVALQQFVSASEWGKAVVQSMG